MKYYIDYYSAVHWLNGDLILFNDIHEIDEEFFCELYREDDDGDLGDPVEIYQYFLTNYSDDDVEWMQKTFPGLHFAFSQKMGLWVLCVDHYGTNWNYVWTECELDWVKGDEEPVPHSRLEWVNDKYESKINTVKIAKFMRCKE